MKSGHLSRLVAFAAFVLLPAAAHAAPEEIQVYIDDMDEPGEIGLDTHINYVATGESTRADYPGAEDSLKRLRITPEFSYGLTRHLEAGLYLPLSTIDRDGHFNFGGVKARLKYIAHPHGNADLWYGVNFEIGHVDRRLDINPWNAEVKGMLGARTGKWLLALNTNVDFVVSGPQPAPATLELASKVSYSISKRVALGFEGYNGVGELKNLGHFGSSEQAVYATADIGLGKWDLNLGVGRGFGANPDKLVVKAIIGVPINGLFARHRAIIR